MNFTAAGREPPAGLIAGLVPSSVFASNGKMPDVPSPAALDGRSSDELLVAIARDRDKDAFGLLFGRMGPRLKAYLLRSGIAPSQADELVQEVMLMVWHRADTFDPARAMASTWIFTIARNKRIDAARRDRRPEFDPEDPALVPDQPAAADRSIEQAEASARLRDAIAKLPAEQADLLRLAYFEDQPHSAIARHKGLPLGTVKSRLRLALERLRRELAGS
ncbi:RNA polymerase sigma-70 factor (ECF subfamily) [Skermanella aerolata]|uniref:RNA polymerase sigma factor n=1 Tax=Skermanella aerolata TaxID=393310 RepID=A0A512DW51_9PROT|nr:sigma-70 family RNA polymerase sigma factor [Skermanella aerolata]GEO40693.1 RNA polymerase sigma factor [Skermanella aerolata]